MRGLLVDSGFGEDVAEFISRPQKESTTKTYQFQWSLFVKWARGSGVDPVSPTLNELCSFFLHLHKQVGLKPSTIGVYRAAITSVLKFSDPTFELRSAQVLNNLFTRLKRENPREITVLPKWDLELVLRSLLRKPFVDDSGSDKGISLQWFTRKTAFLVALASGARASEIHALSRDPDLLVKEQLPQNGVSLRLQVYPGFIPKNLMPSQVPKPWVIPSLAHLFPDEQEKLLCPVRAINYYLRRTNTLTDAGGRLFIHYNPRVGHTRATHISQWLVDVIKNAYDDVEDLPDHFRPRAHEVRAIAHSWAFFNNVSLPEVLDAARWSSTSTFTGHYLRNVARSVDGLSGFPLVAAQRFYH